MKFYISGINNLLNKIATLEIKGLLLYGPDKGHISQISDNIEKKFDMWRSNITYQEFNNSDHNVLLNSQNFLNKRELVKILNVSDTLSPVSKKTLNGEFLHFPIFIADELKSNSTLKKFFEDNANLASIGCYYDELNISKIILNKFFEHNKTIDEEAKKYLFSYLMSDSQLINNELNKLLHYIGERTNINLQDVKTVVSPNINVSVDELFIHFANKNLSHFLYQLGKLLKQGFNEVLIIRTLIRYYINIYIILSQLSVGEKLDTSIKNLSPPIFFKYINSFKNIVENTTKNEVVKILQILHQAEIAFKMNPKTFDFYQQIFLLAYPSIIHRL